jgi:hypothetical protein
MPLHLPNTFQEQLSSPLSVITETTNQCRLAAVACGLALRNERLFAIAAGLQVPDFFEVVFA